MSIIIDDTNISNIVYDNVNLTRIMYNNECVFPDPLTINISNTSSLEAAGLSYSMSITEYGNHRTMNWEKGSYFYRVYSGEEARGADSSPPKDGLYTIFGIDKQLIASENTVCTAKVRIKSRYDKYYGLRTRCGSGPDGYLEIYPRMDFSDRFIKGESGLLIGNYYLTSAETYFYEKSWSIPIPIDCANTPFTPSFIADLYLRKQFTNCDIAAYTLIFSDFTFTNVLIA